MGSGKTAPRSRTTKLGIGISRFLRDQGSNCANLGGSGIKSCHTFEIRCQNFVCKKWITDENIISLYDPALDTGAAHSKFGRSWSQLHKSWLYDLAIHRASILGSGATSSDACRTYA